MEVHWECLPLQHASQLPRAPWEIPPAPSALLKEMTRVTSYLADQLQGVPGSVPGPDDGQGWLVIWQTEPGRSEILMDPNVAVGIVLMDAGQHHFFFPLR